MKRKRIGKMIAIAIVFLIVAAAVLLGMGQGVEHLWNWLMPDIFGLRTITFWQAVGLLVLSWILFGGPSWLGPRPRRGSGRMAERWEAMTPEQRAAFREGLRGRCGVGETPVSEPKA